MQQELNEPVTRLIDGLGLDRALVKHLIVESQLNMLQTTVLNLLLYLI